MISARGSWETLNVSLNGMKGKGKGSGKDSGKGKEGDKGKAGGKGKKGKKGGEPGRSQSQDSNKSKGKGKGKPVCWNCGKPGHRSNECRAPKQDTPRGAPDKDEKGKGGVCWKCGQPGHHKKDCAQNLDADPGSLMTLHHHVVETGSVHRISEPSENEPHVVTCMFVLI